MAGRCLRRILDKTVVRTSHSCCTVFCGWSEISPCPSLRRKRKRGWRSAAGLRPAPRACLQGDCRRWGGYDTRTHRCTPVNELTTCTAADRTSASLSLDWHGCTLPRHYSLRPLFFCSHFAFLPLSIPTSFSSLYATTTALFSPSLPLSLSEQHLEAQ